MKLLEILNERMETEEEKQKRLERTKKKTNAKRQATKMGIDPKDPDRRSKIKRNKRLSYAGGQYTNAKNWKK
jgi:hypothetical protein